MRGAKPAGSVHENLRIPWLDQSNIDVLIWIEGIGKPRNQFEFASEESEQENQQLWLRQLTSIQTLNED